jgi:hypothetical protein
LASKKANSEATISSIIEDKIKETLKWHNVDFQPIKEQAVKTLEK